MADYRSSTTNPATRDMTQTPLWLFRAMDSEFNFQLDAAALPETALCERYLTPAIDALAVSWGDFLPPLVRSPWVWLNPPYSDIGPWVEKARQEQAKGIGTVMLVPQDTSPEWYNDHGATEIRHIIGYYAGKADGKGLKWKNGRINFIDVTTGKELKGNPKGSMFLIFAPRYFGETRVVEISKGHLIELGRLAA